MRFQVREFLFLINFIKIGIIVNELIAKGNKNPNTDFNKSACRMYRNQDKAEKKIREP